MNRQIPSIPYGGYYIEMAKAQAGEAVEEAVPHILERETESDAGVFGEAMVGLRDERTGALEGLPAQRIHGDCNGCNYLLYRGDVSGFIDLDHLPVGPRVYDIGYLFADMAKARFTGNPAHRDWLATFHHVVMGYEREQALSRDEKNALWFMMLATQVLFVDWFLLHGQVQAAWQNLAAFTWIYHHRGEIAGRLAGM